MQLREGPLSQLLADIEPFISRHWTRMSYRHIGNAAWARCTLPAEDDPPAATWMDDGAMLACAWVEDGSSLEWVTGDRPDLMDTVLAWFVRAHPNEEASVTVLETEDMAQRMLRRRGFQTVHDAPYFAHMWRALDDLPSLEPLPAGLLARPMRGLDDLDARVAVHRAAWHPSGMTVERYRVLMADPAYRPEFDWVIEAPGGAFAASALLWVDPLHGGGLLEPVGTDPQYRRQGLSRAVCLAALHAYRRAGGVEAIVQPRGDDAYPVPYQLYRGMGFEPITRTLTFRRPRT